MGETFEKRLREVSILDIYDDIAAISMTPEQLIQTCIEIPCSVNLKTGNLIYSVEQKYKHKLAKYKNSKRLKWLKVNLKAIVPNPEEKILKWQARHRENKKYNWVQRKLHALDNLVNDELIVQSEEPCCSRSLFLASERRMSQQSRGNSRRSSYRDVDSSYSTAANTSAESVQTVIASQPKLTQETDIGDCSPILHFNLVSRSLEETESEDRLPLINFTRDSRSVRETDIGDSSPLINFKHVSRSTLSSSSGELPSLCVEGTVLSEENKIQTQDSTAPSKDENDIEKEAQSCRKRLLQESEEHSTQEEVYATFYQDMQVTSTQEFG